MKVLALPTLLLALLSSGVMASDWEVDMSVNLGLTAGFDDDVIHRAEIYDANTNEFLGNSKVRAGGLYYTGLGLQVGTDNWGVLTNAAYHFTGTSSNTVNNQRATFRRFSYDLLPYYRINNSFRVGAGATYHASPRSTLSLSQGKQHSKYDDAVGVTVFGGYQLPHSKSWVELRYTDINYDAKASGDNDVDGAHFGLIIHWIPNLSTPSYRQSAF